MPLGVDSDIERARLKAAAFAEAGQRCAVEFDPRKEPHPYRIERLDIGDLVRVGDLRPAGVRIVSVHAVPARFTARRRTAA